MNYAALAYNEAGNRISTNYNEITIETGDITPPVLQIYHRPAHPRATQRVTFIAEARDPSGIAKIEILVNQRIVERCTSDSCRHIAGPFPQGTVTYGANAYDSAGNKAWSGQKSFVVPAPEPAGDSTISGRLTGERDLVSQVAAYNWEQPIEPHIARPDSGGRYRITDLPEGHYRVVLFPQGKFDLISDPRYGDVRCRRSQTYTVSFRVKGYREG
jgi:hypothetical protein